MAYQTIYRFNFKNDEGQTLIIHISDTNSGVGTPVYTDLTIASCQLEVANSGDDVFAIVRASTLSFSFIPTQTYGLNTFKSGVDRRFLVEAFAANTSIPIFKGYLLTDETREALLPKSANGEWAMSTVEMTAIDNLATLKEFPLTDDTEANPRGWFSPIQYLAWVLKKTGHELPINIVDSIVYAVYPETEGNWYNTTFLWSKSFEADVNVSIDCYEALEFMLKGRFIVQYLGEWWIVRVDEMIGGTWNIFKYDSDGAYIALDTNTFEKTLGKTQAIKFLNKDAFVFPVRPHKYDLLEYRYELPKELIDNYNFERGAQTSFTAGPPHIGKYAIDDWDLVRAPNLSPTTNAYIRRVFLDINQTYEIDRHIVIEANANFHYLRSNPVFIMNKDKVIFSFDRKLTGNHSGGGVTTELLGQLRLVGDDGTYWTCVNIPGSIAPVGAWVASNSTFTFQSQLIGIQYNANNQDERDWQTVTVESDPVPVGGSLYFVMYASSLHATTDDTHFTNVNLDYIPYILGDYSKLSAQYHKVSQTDDYKANLEYDVTVSDSPKRLFKGALHFELSPGVYSLIGPAVYDYRLTPSGGLLLDKFGKYQAFDFFNQSFDFVNKIQSSFTGMNSLTNPSDMPGMIHQYEIDFTSNDDHTAARWFQFISFKQDLITCKWEGVLVPTSNATLGHLYTWDHEFKYRPQ